MTQHYPSSTKSGEWQASAGPAGRNRRSFLQVALAAGVAPLVLPSARGAEAAPGRKLRVGMVGCGKRGTLISKLMREHGGYEVVAAADYFPDALETYAKEFGVPQEKCFTGLRGYEKLLAQKEVEVVGIESPPFFHPEQAAAAVKAGKHVYIAKPVAVDVAGCFSIEASGAEATRKGLVFLVDFQTRANEIFVEAMRRVHGGALGRLCFGESFYHDGDPFKLAGQVLGPDPQDPERRLRAWGVDRVLSGDIITEQNIHTLDVMSWIMNETPKSAVGTGNQKARPWGNCRDHFSVIFQYSDGVDVNFSSRQFAGHGTTPEGIVNRMFGVDGVLETAYAGPVLLRGTAKNFYRGGDTAGLYRTGPQANLVTFYGNVLAGEASNPTVAPSVRSNLVSILGREAADRGVAVTWEEMLRQRTPLKLGLELRA